MERSARLDTDSSVTTTKTKRVPPKMRRSMTGYKKKCFNTQEQGCGTKKRTN